MAKQMQCPSCQSTELNITPLEEGLTAYTCNQCEGLWISPEDYWSWLEEHSSIQLEQPALPEPSVPMKPAKRAKLCPACSHILIHYQVGQGIPFWLEHCGNCGGIWLTQPEWGVLKNQHLHDKIYKILTIPWQRQRQQEETRKHLQTFIKNKFSETDYLKIQEIKQWIDQHPQRQEVLDYLNNQDPYVI